MGRLYELQSQLLQDGKITDQDVVVIRGYLQGEGKLDIEDVKFLVELLSNAREVAPSFDELFFPILKDVLLADGRIGMDEQFYLLKMLYSDGHVREREKQFLQELRRNAQETTHEFEALCDEALSAHPTNWSVGGKVPREVER
ncbi:MAG: TerB family tellurite resistance protein [Pirellulales bacterium]|nr:TerB family tellurite resistance protein [Pirellulales bacterium]